MKFEEALQASLDLQKEHGIQKMCAYHVGVLYKAFRDEGVEFKVGILVYDGLFVEHAWLVHRGEVFEASWEFTKYRSLQYMSLREFRARDPDQDWPFIIAKLALLQSGIGHMDTNWEEYVQIMTCESTRSRQALIAQREKEIQDSGIVPTAIVLDEKNLCQVVAGKKK